MSKCIITKLKTVVENDNLEEIGVIYISLKTDSNGSVPLSSSIGSECRLTVLSNGVTITSVSGTGAVLIGPKTAIIANDGWKATGNSITFSKASGYVGVKISNRYYLNDLRGFARPEYLQYLIKANELRLENYNDYGFYYLSSLSSSTSLWHLEMNNQYTYGELKDLKENTHLIYLNLYNSKVTGSIEDFVVAQRANGRTTCNSIRCVFGNTGITFNGGNISGSGEKVLSWTATTITFDGETINT